MGAGGWAVTVTMFMYSFSASVFECSQNFLKKIFRPTKTHNVRMLVSRNVPAREQTTYRRVLSPEFVFITHTFLFIIFVEFRS